MHHFPAAPGSVMMRFKQDGGYTDIYPILGWVYVSGMRADPIFPVAISVTPLDMFMIPTGDNPAIYLHPHAPAETFEDGQEAGRYMAQFAEEWAKRGIDKPREEPEGVASKFAKEIAADPEIKDMFEGKADTRPLHFGEKTFKQQSFWHWPDANCVFAIPGESALPSDPRVLKITGDEFRELKRDGADVIDPHNGVTIEAGPTEEPVPAKPKRDVSDAI